MPILPRNLLRSFFERGDKPTEGQFGALIDSMLHKSEDSSLLGLREYDITKSYLIGDAVIHSDFIFQAISNTSGTFDPAAWKKLLSIGSLSYKGAWNASTNVPHLTSSTGINGDYYIVGVSGNTTLDGISTWATGDHVLFNGSVWERVINASSANTISYDNTASGLSATQVQAAIDEVELRIEAAETSIGSLTTSAVPEGSNLYYTVARFDSALASKTTDDLTEGATNLYYTASNFNASFSTKSTDELAEGNANLYFTNERVDDRVSQLLTAVNGLQFIYYDNANLLEIKMPDGLGGGTMRYNGAEWVNSSLLYNNEIKIGINTNGTSEALLGITGRGSTSANQALSIQNSVSNGLLEVWDDGLVTIGYTAHTGTDSRVILRNTDTWGFSNAAEIYQTRTAAGSALSITSDGTHGGINYGVKLSISGGATNYAIYAADGDVWMQQNLSVNAGNLVVNQGTVGIGTSADPNTKITATSILQNTAVFENGRSNGTATSVFANTYNTNTGDNIAGWFRAQNGANNYAIRIDYGDFCMTGTGHVAIGATPSPGYKVHVADSTSDIALNVEQGKSTDTSTGGFFYTYGAGTLNRAGVFTAVNATTNYAIEATYGDVWINEGNVAIGAFPDTTSRLHVVSSHTYTGLFEGGKTDGTCVALRGYAFNTNTGDNIAGSFTAVNGANNYAIYIDQGDFLQSSGKFALATSLNDSSRMRVKGMSDTGDTYSIFLLNASEIESFSVKDDGEVYAARIKTDMIAESEAPTWKLGNVRSTAGLSMDTFNYIEVEINGTRYNLALVRP